jgi:hypothetical protein
MWVSRWLRQWNVRVKLVTGNDAEARQHWKRSTADLKKGEARYEEIDHAKIEEYIASALIRNGLLCGTQIVASNLLKLELAKESKLTGDEFFCDLVYRAASAAKSLANTTGPVIFLRVDGHYYSRT